VQVGAYVHLADEPFRETVAPDDLARLEGELGGRLDIIHYFLAWGAPFGRAVTANADGRRLMLSMKPDRDLVRQIAAGQQDDYIIQFARDAASFGQPVFIRFGHEMNGEWMDYSAARPGGPTAEQFRTAWVRLVRTVRAYATNVQFVWCPNEGDFPARPGNTMEDYWPGDEWVDIAAFDAFNWSERQPRRGDGRWRSFDEMVQGPYDRVARISAKPIWLGEFGTTDPEVPPDPPSASKGQWFRDMFASRRFPRLAAVIYFSENDERDTQRDWRIDSSTDSLKGFREGWSLPSRPAF
jgi:beta-mannanase